MKATLVLTGMSGVALAVWAAPLVAKPAPEPPIKVPDFEVWESPVAAPGEDWRYARVERFEILSKVPDHVGSNLVGELQKFHHAMAIIYPKIAERPAQPLALILADGARYAPFLPPGVPGDRQELGLFFHTPEKSVIVVDADADSMLLPGSATEYNTVDIHRQLSRQYLRYLFAERRTSLPAWLEEGLSQTIADIETRGKWLTYGKIFTDQNAPGAADAYISIPDPFAANPGLSGLSFKYLFAHRAMLPMDQLLHPPLPDSKRPSSDSVWAKQTYAFVHFCLFGNKLRYRDPLIKYAERLQNEPDSEALFTACFGVGHEQMNKELRAYIVHTRHKYQRYPLKPEQQFKETPLVFRDASESETGLIKGEALQLADHPHAALEFFRQSYLRGARSPDFLAGFAASCAHAGDSGRARKLIDVAVAKGATRPSALVLQAQLRFDAARAMAAGADGKLDDRQLASILEPLYAANKLPPPVPAPYDLMASAWLVSATPPKVESLAVLDGGIRQFPRHVPLLTQSFELYRRAGDIDKAASIARLGARLAGDSATKAQFEHLAETLPPSAPKT